MSFDRMRPLNPTERFCQDRRGGVAVTFGLLLLPMIGAIALAIDFGNIMTMRTKAQMAADAAALQAAGIARDLIKGSDGSDAIVNAAVAEAKKRATALFDAHAQQAGLKDYTVNVMVTKTGQNLAASADFNVKSPNFISTVFGFKSFAAKGGAVSGASLPNWSDVYLALDISGSMGIAANQAEMAKLFKATAKRSGGGTQATGCMFGCHTIETDNGWAESFSTVATRNGIRLRIDVLRDAVIDMITTAQSDAASAPIYRLALYTMGASADASTWSMNALASLTDNFSSLKTAAKTIDIATPPSNAPQKQNSYINEQLDSFKNNISASGDGSSQLKSKKYLFIITDGVRDVPPSFGSCTTPPKRTDKKDPYYNMSSGRCTNAINPVYCKTFKDKGITVGVLYTTYVPLPKDAALNYDPNTNIDQWFGFEVKDNPIPNDKNTKVYDKLQPALQACASEGWFFEASDDDGIEKAMVKMFAQTTNAPSLVN